uniref:Uncharacterized protein n=1 Tax=Oryza brachyantha TaxID=4533 RepID=J3LE62_ORYBR
MGRSPCCEKEAGLKKGPWTPEEDQKLLAYIEQHGHGCWRSLPTKAGLRRCGKSCRLRWTNYLRPDIKRGKFTLQEEQTIIQLHALLGNRWSAIATHLPKRTDNEIKNYWNTHLKKRLTKMGIDPARLAREAKLRALASPPATATAALSGVDSPTSTLSFSESALFGAGGAAPDIHSAARAAAVQALQSYGEACQEHHFGGGAAAETSFAGAGALAGVLLDCSVTGADQRFAARTEAGSGELQGEDDDDKGYWNSILNMVNSSMSSSSSSSLTSSEVVADPEMFLPTAAAATQF